MVGALRGPSSELHEEGRCQRAPTIPALRADCPSLGDAALALGDIGSVTVLLWTSDSLFSKGGHGF